MFYDYPYQEPYYERDNDWNDPFHVWSELIGFYFTLSVEIELPFCITFFRIGLDHPRVTMQSILEETKIKSKSELAFGYSNVVILFLALTILFLILACNIRGGYSHIIVLLNWDSLSL